MVTPRHDLAFGVTVQRGNPLLGVHFSGGAANADLS
jgi:hypothetical protein